MLRVCLPLVLAALANAAGAQVIFKCIEGDTTAYQSTACANGAVESRLMVAQRARADAPALVVRPQVARTQASSSERSDGTWRVGWPRRRTLALGMTDDEVLNLPGWGIPTRIVRARTLREWREEWVYARQGSGERRLRFVNTKLVEADHSPGEQLARMSAG